MTSTPFAPQLAQAGTNVRPPQRSVLGVLGGLGRGLAQRAGASVTTRAGLDLAGLGGITYGAFLLHHAAGFIVGGMSALIFSARLGS